MKHFRKLIPHRVTIRPCNIGRGYFYRDQCFAYVWAMKAGSLAWWKNLLVIADINDQTALKFVADLERRCRDVKRGGR